VPGAEVQPGNCGHFGIGFFAGWGSSKWNAVVEEVWRHHHRKYSFIGGFEQIVAGRGHNEKPSFLERARKRWFAAGLG
jgi:hypothetical protein